MAWYNWQLDVGTCEIASSESFVGRAGCCRPRFPKIALLKSVCLIHERWNSKNPPHNGKKMAIKGKLPRMLDMFSTVVIRSWQGVGCRRSRHGTWGGERTQKGCSLESTHRNNSSSCQCAMSTTPTTAPATKKWHVGHRTRSKYLRLPWLPEEHRLA